MGKLAEILGEDSARMEENRQMVKNKENTSGYKEVEYAMRFNSLHKPLPRWIRCGELPRVVINRETLRELESRGFILLGEPGSIKTEEELDSLLV